MNWRKSFGALIAGAANDWLPPVLRDSALFGAVARAAFGARIDDFQSLREHAPTMTTAELRAFYGRQVSRRSRRVSDNTSAVVARVGEDAVPGSLCDVGCGTGHLIGRLAQRGDLRAFGVDLNIAPDNHVGGVAFIEAAIERLPFADRAFDTIVSTHTLEHALDIEAAVRELRRVAAQRLIIVVPRERPYRFGLNAHLHYFVYPWQLALVLRPRGAYVCDRIGAALYYCEVLP